MVAVEPCGANQQLAELLKDHFRGLVVSVLLLLQAAVTRRDVVRLTAPFGGVCWSKLSLSSRRG
jgi:hypothetical protein